MKTEFSCKGFWFLPEYPNDKVAGILHFIPYKSISLELIGEFQNHPCLSNNREWSVIHGVINSAQKITLCNCRQGFGSGHTDGCDFSIVNYFVQFIFEGVHLSALSDQIFNKIKFKIPLLDKWLGKHAIQDDCKYKNNELIGVSLNWDVNKIEPIKIPIDINTEIEFLFTPSVFKKNASSFHLQQETNCNIVSNIVLSSEELYKKAQLFRFFLSLATKAPIDYDQILLVRDNEAAVSFYFIQKRDEDTQDKHQKWLTYNMIEKEFPEIIKKWYENRDKMLPIIIHLVESLMPSKYFGSRDFLIVVQALDGFHRRFIKNQCDSFEKRLKAIKGKFSDIVKISSLETSFASAAETRHYYSHFFKDSDLKGKMLDVDELVQMTKELRVLLYCCVLHEIGFPHELINKIL